MQSLRLLKGRETVPDLLIRNVPEHIMRRLKDQAKRNHRSVQREALEIIESGTQLTMAEWLERTHALQQELRAEGFVGDSTPLIREDRDS